MEKKLLEPAIVEEIKKCKSFDDIFTIVYELKIPYFSSLYVYDTFLRIGVIFDHYPDVIYLHQGAFDGAIRLLGKDKLNRLKKCYMNDEKFPYLEKEQFPKELQLLEPHHIENFLCRTLQYGSSGR